MWGQVSAEFGVAGVLLLAVVRPALVVLVLTLAWNRRLLGSRSDHPTALSPLASGTLIAAVHRSGVCAEHAPDSALDHGVDPVAAPDHPEFSPQRSGQLLSVAFDAVGADPVR